MVCLVVEEDEKRKDKKLGQDKVLDEAFSLDFLQEVDGLFGGGGG